MELVLGECRFAFVRIRYVYRAFRMFMRYREDVGDIDWKGIGFGVGECEFGGGGWTAS